MPTSTSERAYVWTWLPDASEPVPAGLLVRQVVVNRRVGTLARDADVGAAPEWPGNCTTASSWPKLAEGLPPEQEIRQEATLIVT